MCLCHEGVCVCVCGGHSRVAKDHHILNIINHTMHIYIAGIDKFPERETGATISELIWFAEKGHPITISLQETYKGLKNIAYMIWNERALNWFQWLELWTRVMI